VAEKVPELQSPHPPWNKLDLKGTMPMTRGRDSEKIQLRNCSCGSTLAVPESATKKSDPPSSMK
jgi:hypothetical protein